MADRYWVGGTGSWNTTTTNWSTSSGGSGGASAPSSSDDVYFDANSGGGTCTVTSGARTCRSISFRGFSGTSNYTGTFTLTGTLAVSGGLIFAPPASMTIGASSSTITFNGAGSFNITYNGQSNTSAITFNNASGNWTCTDAIIQQRILTFTAGNLTFSTDATLTNLTKTSSGTLTTSSGTLTYTGTLSNSAGIVNIGGNVTGAALTITGGTVNLNGTTTNITDNITLSAGTLNINSVNAVLSTAGFGVLLSSTGTLNVNVNATFNRATVTGGTLFYIANGVTLTINGATGATVSQFDISTSPTTTTFTGSTIKMTNTSTSLVIFNGGGLTYNIVWFARGTSTGSNRVLGNNTFNTLKDDGSEAHTFRFGDASTQTILTSFDINGSASNKKIILDKVTSGVFNLVYSGSGSVECNYLDVRNSSATPYNPITEEYTWFANGSIQSGTVTGWSVIDARYWVGGSGNWNDTNKWALTSNGSGGNSVPDSTRTAIFDSNSGTGSVNINVASSCYGFDCTTALAGLTFTGSNTLSVYQDAILSSGFGNYTNQLIMRCSSGRTIYLNTNGTSLNCIVTINGTGSVILKSNLTTTSYINHSLGTFNTSYLGTSYDITCAYYQNKDSNITTLNLNNSTITCTSKGTVVSGVTTYTNVCWFATNNNLTLNSGTSSIIFTDSTNNSIYFAGGGKTYYLVHFNRGASTGLIQALSVSPATQGNTYNEFRDTGTAAHEIQWATLGQTFNIFNVNGASSSAKITLNSSGSTNYSFVSTNTGITYCENIIVNDCTATPSKKFYANVSNSTIGATTTGWNDPRGGGLTLLGVG
jgi:hypothetical protein